MAWPERLAQGGTTMSGTPTFGRYAEIPVDQMTPAQRDGYRFMVDGPRGRLPGPYKVWVHNPKLMHAAAPLGQHFTPEQSSLTEREREIAVIIMTSRWHSAYPTAAHEKRGKEVGLAAATVEALVAGRPASFSDPREQVVYEMATTFRLERPAWPAEGGAMTTLKITPLHPALGAEIAGVDLAKPVDASTRQT